MLSDTEARAIIDAQVVAINSNWDAICDEADLSPIDRTLFKDRLFLNAYAFEGYNE
jgi:serine/threonine-protein kinase HipA